MSSPNSSPIATVTNNLGYDVDIYDVYNLNAGTQGPLTYTKLATVPSGATAQQVQTIHFASQLQAMHTGNIAALNNDYYEQFPVAVLAVSPFAPSLAFTLTSDMEQGMEESFKFIKYTTANPSSQMATNFRTALGDKTSQKTAVDTFFQSTASFKQCTLSTWTAVFSWQAQFTNPWQGTYYLYSLGPSSDGSTTGSSAPALIATLAIVASAQANSAVVTMADTNNENTPVVMAGDGTMQEQDQGTGNLSVVLNPTWLNITQTSQQDGNTVTRYVIGAAFTGTINEVKVAGNLNQLIIPTLSDNTKNATDKNSANSFIITSTSQLVGMLTGIGMLYYMMKGHKQAEMQRKNDAQKDAKDKSDAEEKEDQVEADFQSHDVSLARSESEQLELNIVPEVQGAYEQVDQAVDIERKEADVEKQEEVEEEVLEDGPAAPATEDSAINLEKAQIDLEKATNPATSSADRDVAVADATTDLNKTTTELKQELADQSIQLSQEEEQAQEQTEKVLENEQEQADAVEENEQKQEEQDKNDQEEDVGNGEFDDPVAEPIAEA